MRVPRHVVVVVVLGTVLTSTGSVSLSAPRPACNLVVDAKGDSGLKGLPIRDASLDVASADLASDRRFVTGAIRLADLSATSPYFASGRDWFLYFTPQDAKHEVYFQYLRSARLGEAFLWGQLVYDPATGGKSHVPRGGALGHVDTARNEIHVTVRTAALRSAGGFSLGSTLRGLRVTTFARTHSYVHEVDLTRRGRDYRAGSTSCVTPGR